MPEPPIGPLSISIIHRTLTALALTAILTSCAWLDYPRLNIHTTITTGGQTQIDAGHIVDVNGLPGIWLAAHRTTHGAPFNTLTQARTGDQVCAYSSCYTVTAIITVPTTWTPRYLAPLVLQTSLPYGRDLLVIAE